MPPRPLGFEIAACGIRSIAAADSTRSRSPARVCGSSSRTEYGEASTRRGVGATDPRSPRRRGSLRYRAIAASDDTGGPRGTARSQVLASLGSRSSRSAERSGVDALRESPILLVLRSLMRVRRSRMVESPRCRSNRSDPHHPAIRKSPPSRRPEASSISRISSRAPRTPTPEMTKDRSIEGRSSGATTGRPSDR